MSRVCRQCSRINPADAAFCYWDGVLLAGGVGGPINAGSAPFPSQFVFPGGQICRNFDQLATTCQHNWKAAVELLKQGFFASFLGGMGRADLAMTAAEAAKFPDADRGLDQLLARLPTQVLQPPKVQVEPTMISLGVLPMGTDRNLELHLSNLGTRLAYGSVASDCKWLTLGEGQHAGQKLFQFGAEATILVHVKGQFLRAGNQPLEGSLVVDSNGGTVTVTVRADVPITPFADGVLAGSLTPRQIAERARAHPKEAAALFEKGLVSKWFTRNGWIYPVQGPNVAGLGGVQQFFEALGLAKPPKVELKTPSIQLKGGPGQTVSAAIDVGTAEKKHVFAFAVSDKPWIVPGTQPKQGKSPTMATIPLTIIVPGTPGQVQQAKVTVTANGNQKFQVPLTLTVSGSPGDYVPVQAIPLSAGAGAGGPVPIMATPIGDAVMALPLADAATGDKFRTAPAAAIVLAPAAAATPPPLPRPLPALAVANGPPPLPARTRSSGGMAEPVVDISAYRARRRQGLWFHLMPMAALALVLAALMFRDLIGRPAGDGPNIDSAEVDPTKRLDLNFDWGKGKDIGNTMRFGLEAIDPDNPNDFNPKRLTYNKYGLTNSTVALIDGGDRIFGVTQTGRWIGEPKKSGRYTGKEAIFEFTPDRVQVTQTVEIMPGEAFETAAGTGVFKRPLNTCLIKYKVENKDTRSHTVGLRVMIDTFIGDNDGVPFTIPGVGGLVDTFKDFRGAAEIPEFIQALERPDVERPGTVVQMTLKLSKELAPDRVSLTYWPGREHGLGHWEVPIRNIGDDSAVVLYWNPRELKPGARREMAFSYGLGKVTAGKLGLTFGGTLAVGREMTVVAYVADPKPGETATLKLPPGFEFLADSPATQNVPAAERGPDGKTRPSPVTWRVRPTAAGRHTLSAMTSTGLSVSQPVTIGKKGLF